MHRSLVLVSLSLFAVLSAHAADKPHANYDHPAIAAARVAQKAGVDVNHFLVQPPASVTWVAAEAPKQVAAAALPAAR